MYAIFINKCRATIICFVKSILSLLKTILYMLLNSKATITISTKLYYNYY